MARSKNILTEEKENFDLEKYIAIYPGVKSLIGICPIEIGQAENNFNS